MSRFYTEKNSTYLGQPDHSAQFSGNHIKEKKHQIPNLDGKKESPIDLGEEYFKVLNHPPFEK